MFYKRQRNQTAHPTVPERNTNQTPQQSTTTYHLQTLRTPRLPDASFFSDMHLNSPFGEECCETILAEPFERVRARAAIGPWSGIVESPNVH